jgi:uncharacterized protein YoxC
VTKEELLLKGLSEKDADEIISSFSGGTTEENPLQALQKAIGDEDKPENGESDLAKAKPKDEEDEEDEGYNAEYMKKNMKRYMKENKKACQKMMKDMDGAKEEMNKAIENIDPDSDGVVVDMEELSPYLEAQSETIEQLSKAIHKINEQLDVIMAQGEQNYDLMKKAGRVHFDTAKKINQAMSKSSGRKGITADETMEKATNLKTEPQTCWDTLYKATKAGNQKAGEVISKFETAGRRINLLSSSDQEFIKNLMNGGSN